MGGSIWNLGLCVNKDGGSSSCSVAGGNKDLKIISENF